MCLVKRRGTFQLEGVCFLKRRGYISVGGGVFRVIFIAHARDLAPPTVNVLDWLSLLTSISKEEEVFDIMLLLIRL